MDFLQKYFYRVFELPLPRNAQKRAKKKIEKKKVGGWLVPRKLIKYTSRSVHFFFECPSCQARAKGPAKKRKSVAVTPVVGGWVSQRSKKDQGQTYFFNVFELPSLRNASKRGKKNRQKSFFCRFLSIFL
jgi:hypothetical protein